MDTAEDSLRRLLTEVAALRRDLGRLEFEVIRFARAMGLTWETIGEAHPVPISRQRAQQRYNRAKNRRVDGD